MGSDTKPRSIWTNVAVFLAALLLSGLVATTGLVFLKMVIATFAGATPESIVDLSMSRQFLTALFPATMMFAGAHLGEQMSKQVLRHARNVLPAGSALASAPYALFAALFLAAFGLVMWARTDPSLTRENAIPILFFGGFLVGGLLATGAACARAWWVGRTTRR